MKTPRTAPAVIVTPAFVSPAADTGEVTKLGPAAWNAARQFSGGNAGDLIARDPSSSTGASWAPPQQFPVAAVRLVSTAVRVAMPSGVINSPAALFQFTIPANLLAAAGAAIRLSAWYEFTGGTPGADAARVTQVTLGTFVQQLVYNASTGKVSQRMELELVSAGVGQAQSLVIRNEGLNSPEYIGGWDARPTLDLTQPLSLSVDGIVGSAWSDGGIALNGALLEQW